MHALIHLQKLFKRNFPALYMEPLSLLILAVAAFLVTIPANYIGGASFVMLPLLLALGVPPLQAVASNRTGTIGIYVAALPGFHKHHLLDWKLGIITGSIAVVGSILGAFLLPSIHPEVMKNFIAIATLTFVVAMLFFPKKGISKETEIRKRDLVLGGLFLFVIGFYNGIFGGGAGTMVTFVLVLFFGQTFLESAGTRKLTLLFSSLAAVVVYLLSPALILWDVVLALLIGNVAGIIISTHYVGHLKNEWVKYAFIAVAIVLTLKLFI
jgi:uncharacterized protein